MHHQWMSFFLLKCWNLNLNVANSKQIEKMLFVSEKGVSENIG